MERTTEQFQRDVLAQLGKISSALERIANHYQQPELGLIDAPTLYPIFIGGDNDEFCWYTLDKDSRQVPIQQNALAGRITSISLVDKQYKGDTNKKLDIHIAADRDYLIRCGLGTIASRCLLLALWTLPPEHLRGEIVTITMRRGQENKVVFAEIYREDGAKIHYEWVENADWLSLATTLVARTNQ